MNSKVLFFIAVFSFVESSLVAQITSHPSLDSLVSIKKEVLRKKQRLDYELYSQLVLQHKQSKQEEKILDAFRRQKELIAIGWDTFNLNLHHDNPYIIRIEEKGKAYTSLLLFSHYTQDFFLVTVNKDLVLQGFLFYQAKKTDSYFTDPYVGSRKFEKDKKKYKYHETLEHFSYFQENGEINKQSASRTYDNKTEKLVSFENHNDKYRISDTGKIVSLMPK